MPELGTPAAARTRPRLSNDPAFGLALLATGFLLIVCVTLLEERAGSESPWSGAVLVLNSEPAWSGTIPARARRVPLANFPTQSRIYEEILERSGRTQVDAFHLDRTEYLIRLDAPRALFESMIDSGRLPEPGADEVLAGVFARADAFEIDDRTFRVVGRLRRDIAGLHFVYLLPRHPSHGPLFERSDAAVSGWFDPAGLDKMREVAEDVLESETAEVVGNAAQPTVPAYAFGTVAGLALVAIGGAFTQIRLFILLGARRSGPLKPVFVEITRHPFASFFVHAALYGGFFAFMLAGLRYPVPNMWLQNIFREAFTEGSLEYVGTAMASGNIPLAAAAIFANNYAVHTLAYTFAPSLVVPFFGLLKNAAVFSVTGLGMSPLWTGMASGYIYHAVTMTLELEAYVVATFAICRWPFDVLRGPQDGKSFAAGVSRGLKMIGSAALLTGIMLAIAAVYEAATLILLGGV